MIPTPTLPSDPSLRRPEIAELIRAWDAQQAAYIADREHRFTVMADVVAETVPADSLIVDLACGPGSLAVRLLERLPEARVVAIDIDPVLLWVARESARPFGDRLRVVEGDLASASWADALDGERPGAAVSTTALHWLLPDELVRLYGELGFLLPAGGVFLDGDHLRFGDDQPTLQTLALRHDAATQRDAFAAGAMSWDEWWQGAAAVPEIAELIDTRAARFAGRPVPPPTTVEFHLAALRQAGFGEVGTLWQEMDDYIVFARR